MDFGGNGFAGTAPFGESVDDDKFVGAADGGIEFCLTVELLVTNFHFHSLTASGDVLGELLDTHCDWRRVESGQRC